MNSFSMEFSRDKETRFKKQNLGIVEDNNCVLNVPLTCHTQSAANANNNTTHCEGNDDRSTVNLRESGWTRRRDRRRSPASFSLLSIVVEDCLWTVEWTIMLVIMIIMFCRSPQTGWQNIVTAAIRDRICRREENGVEADELQKERMCN